MPYGARYDDSIIMKSFRKFSVTRKIVQRRNFDLKIDHSVINSVEVIADLTQCLFYRDVEGYGQDEA
ncbi:hypothetical protein SDC9_206050 [bioreactor metagenome]|uniref:Uncharacterized protein n=1 Tax=bioreactor metagenome TaxID=1076179 RepID=A0A645J4H4_9ZZZZ